MNDNGIVAAILGALLGFIVGGVFFVFYGSTYLPMTFTDEAAARQYQAICLDNGYVVRIQHREGVFTITCEKAND